MDDQIDRNLKRKHSTIDPPSGPPESQTQAVQEIKRYKAIMHHPDTSFDLLSEFMETSQQLVKTVGRFQLQLPPFYSDVRPGKMVQLYNAKCQASGQEMVVKEQPMKAPAQTELKALQYFTFSKYCPKFFGYEIDGRNLFIGLEKLSADLWVIQQHLHNVCFTRSTTARVAVQCLAALEDFHSIGIVHADIKTRNFMVTDLMCNGSDVVRLIDYGTARAWRNKDGVPSAPKNIGHSVGTYRYASIAVHQHLTPTRVDDLISLFYSIYEMLFINLPWVNAGVDDSPGEMLLKKLGDHNLQNLAKEIGPPMEDYVHYVMQLQYDSRIDYQFLKNCFEQLVDKKEKVLDDPYDWIVQKLAHRV